MNKTICAIACLFLFQPMTLSLAATTVPFRQEVDLIDHKQKAPESEFDQLYREKADDDAEAKLQKEKIRAALAELEPKRKRIASGQDQVFFLFAVQQRLLAAQLDFHKKPTEIIALLERHVEFARQNEAEHKLRLDNGIGRPDDHAQAMYFRADAELQLFRAKRKYKVVDGDDGNKK